MDRRTFLAGTAASGLFDAVIPAMAAGKLRRIKTRWIIRESEGFDAISFLSPLSGDPFYRDYYENEVAQFAPRMPGPAMDALRALKTQADSLKILLSPYLDGKFAAASDATIDEVIVSAEHADERLLPRLRADVNWGGDREWGQLKAVLPVVAMILGAMREAGFSDFRKAIIAPKAARLERLRAKVAGYDVIRGAEFYTGRTFDSTIEVILLEFCKPHGIRILGQRFLSAIDWPDEIHLRTAGHELLHPPIPAAGAANRAALAVLANDPLFARIVREHDPKWGYNSLGGILEEDLVSAIDQLIAERSGVARNPRERWNNVDDGMHVLSAGFYSLMRADGFALRGGNLEQWLLRNAKNGRLAPGPLHAAAAKVLGRPADQLWPAPTAKHP